MGIKRLTMRVLAGLTLWAGFGLSAHAQPPAMTVESAIGVKPRQPGVTISTPTPDQVPRCTVTPIPSADPMVKTPIGYVVRDAAGKPVRQFVSYDNKTFNIYAFYVDGVEAYREVYPPQPSEPYQFRWLGPNGTKWGLDRNRDYKIDEWVVMSPEELSQELLQAVLTKDADRVKALTLTKANLDALGLPPAEATKLLERAAGAPKRASDAADALKLSAHARWVHVELNAPQTTPADALGNARDDLVVHRNGTVLVQDGPEGKETKFLQTGELVQIGRAWKLVEGPGGGPVGGDTIIPEIQGLVKKLEEIDTAGPAQPITPATLAAYNAKRAGVLEEIVVAVGKAPAAQQETWVKQLVDSLSSATEGEKLDGKHISRLKQIKDALAKGPNTTLAAYATFRFLQAENSISLATNTEFNAVQDKWRANLEEFVKAYPNSDEAPEAILRLAMAFEYVKDGESKAKDWYSQLSQKYGRYPQAAKGAGALKRLESEGKPLDLAGPTLANGQQFTATSLQGKVVVVYYCANWSRTLPEDAKKLQAIEKEYGPKGLAVVIVSLDHDANTAKQTVAAYNMPGTVLHAQGGLDASPLASGYGILVVPHMFIAGKDGKVVSRNAQIATLEDDVKKLLP